MFFEEIWDAIAKNAKLMVAILSISIGSGNFNAPLNHSSMFTVKGT